MSPQLATASVRSGKSASSERLLVLVFCALGALRVFIYAAAFPFFNNVDEPAHFDLVVKYSQGQVPRGLMHMSPQSAHLIARYGSSEFFLKPAQHPDGQLPPPRWRQAYEAVAAALANDAAAIARVANHETTQPPLYYALAALWMKLGGLFGFSSGILLYWVRFLNPLVLALTVWVAYLVAANLFPDRRLLRIAVPMLVAGLPQDLYYGIQSDVLSPLCYGLAFYHLIRFLRVEIPSERRAILAGLALAATCLVKSNNWPLLLVGTTAILVNANRLRSTKAFPKILTPYGLLLLSAWTPFFALLGWNLTLHGDLTGNGHKVQALGWTTKSFLEWFQHPIFTPRGAFTFWTELMARFWHGEFVWQGEPLRWSPADVFYWASSALFLILALTALLLPSRRPPPGTTRLLWLAFGSFASLVMFLGLLSIVFHFGNCPYPSQQHPYFTSGRLLGGALIPFALLYAYGLDQVLARVKNSFLQYTVPVGIILFVSLSEAFVNRPAFASPYNWFHLVSRPPALSSPLPVDPAAERPTADHQ